MLDKEAVISIAVIEGVVLAAIPILARMFGWDVDIQDDVTVFALAVVALAAPLIAGVIQRMFVWSKATRDAELDAAIRDDAE